MSQVNRRRDLTPELAALLAAGVLAALAVAAIAAGVAQSPGVRTPTSPIQIAPAGQNTPLAPAEQSAPVVPAASTQPEVQIQPTTAPEIGPLQPVPPDAQPSARPPSASFVPGLTPKEKDPPKATIPPQN
ncbi:MAG: hypothetical protein M3T56_12480 [Chloroflexota bacterium]|nr:hypothetical protein [Chloroflexota bacterium]